MLKRDKVEAVKVKPSGATAQTTRRLACDWLLMWNMLAQQRVVYASREGEARGAGRMLAQFLGLVEKDNGFLLYQP